MTPATASPSLVERLRSLVLDAACKTADKDEILSVIGDLEETLTAAPAPEDAELVKRAGKWAMKLEANASNIRENSPGLINVPKKLDRQAKLLRDLADRLSRPASAHSDRLLILGFPWDESEPDEALEKCEAAAASGLLALKKTEPGSTDEYEYGDYVYRLTEKGRAAMRPPSPIASPGKEGQP